MKIEILQPHSIFEIGSRQNQEDYIYPGLDESTTESRLFVLCDGMGGHEKGEVASKTVCESITRYIQANVPDTEIFEDDMLIEAINGALNELDALDDEQSTRKMGTTLALVCFHKGGCTMAHIGDSRIYHIRPSEQRILYKSRDHSLVYDLLAAGDITLEDMKDHPKKNVITRALLPHQEEPVKACIAHTTDIETGDYFYLCSDGMLEEMSDDELVNILASEQDDTAKCEILRETTKDNADNHSAHLIQVSEIVYEEDDKDLPNDEATVRFNSINLERESRLSEQVKTAAEEKAAGKFQLPLHTKQIILSSLLSNRIIKDILLVFLGFILAILLMKL